MNSKTAILKSFGSQSLLVIGELMLDTYIKGHSTRLCPEAPVPVIDFEKEIHEAGGAANTALNLASLGAAVRFCSVCGEDESYLKTMKILEEAGVDSSGIEADPLRSTLQKTRIMAGKQITCRVDQGSTGRLSEEAENRFIKSIHNQLEGVGGVIISDYNKGLLSKKVIDFLACERLERDFFLAIDSKNLGAFKSLKPDLIKPNFQEAQELLQISINPTERLEALAGMGDRLFELTWAKNIALSLDEDGAMLFVYGIPAGEVKAPKIARPFVSGAGDTFLAVSSLVLMSAASFEEAAEIACGAASIVLSRYGTSTCFPHELEGFFSRNHKLVTGTTALEKLCAAYHKEHKKIVFTNGCFDILHSGHVGYLEDARKLGDVLVVGLNNDGSIKRLKGDGRPINSLVDRIKVLSGLASVDHIICFGKESDDTPASLIPFVKPDVFVKGGDYSLDNLPEAELVENCGGKIIILPYLPGRSTTETIQRMQEAKGSTFDV